VEASRKYNYDEAIAAIPPEGLPPPADADANLVKVEHIVVLMMENRSFDHMLGFLSIDRRRGEVDGPRPGLKNTVNAQDPDHSGEGVDEQARTGR
jgi:phospholipase C